MNPLPDLERRLAVQLALSHALAESETSEEAVARALREVGAQLGWRFGAYWSGERSGGELVLRATEVWRSDDALAEFEAATLARRLRPGEGLPGVAWATGEPAWATDISTIANFPRREAASRAGLRSAFAFPARVGAAVLGVLEFFAADIERVDDTLVDAARGMGFQLGQFLDRKRAIAAGREAEIRSAAIVEMALDCIVSIDSEGCIVEWNPAAERTFGHSRAEAIGRKMVDLIVPPRLREAHARGMARYLATGEPHVLGRRIEVEGLRADGTEIPVELAIVRVPLPGPPTFSAYIRDLSEQRRLRAAQELLLRASTMLGESLEYERTLRNLSAAVVPAFADWYAVDILDEDGRVRRIEVKHQDPDRVRVALDLAERYPDDPDSPHGVHAVIRTARSQWMPDVPEALLTAIARDDEHLRMLRELGLRSFIIAPLLGRHRVHGAISFVTAESRRCYDEQDLSVAEDLARRAAQAIENARLFQQAEESRELLEQQAMELEAQAAELEETAEALETSNAELRRANEELARRTADAEQARLEADAARGAAEEANRAKSDFLASMSHELRTPLNAIIGYAQLLDVGIHGAVSTGQRDDLQRIMRSSQHLLGLINDILTFAKVERGRVEYDLEYVALDEVLGATEDLILPQARAKSIEYRYARRCPRALVCADREKLAQIFVNLLSNAVKYTPDGGRVVVECATTDDDVLVRVRDTGVGIPADQLDAIFEPFVQVEREYAGQTEGTGLGLAISRELARGMGGDLTVDSEVGVGSTFTLRLKREEPEGAGSPRPRPDTSRLIPGHHPIPHHEPHPPQRRDVP